MSEIEIYESETEIEVNDKNSQPLGCNLSGLSDKEEVKTKSKQAKEEIRARSKKAYEKNKEEVKARSRQTYNKNKEEIKQRAKIKYEEHKEELKQKSKNLQHKYRESYRLLKYIYSKGLEITEEITKEIRSIME